MSNSDEVIHELWVHQRAWSQAADCAKKEVGRYRVISLLLVVLASVLGAGAPLVSDLSEPVGRACALVAGLSLGLIPLVRRRLTVPTYERWSRLRSVSEALKVEIYTFLAGVTPYRDDDRTATLFFRSEAVVRRGDDLLGWLRSKRPGGPPCPPVTDVASYMNLRVRPQINKYYLRKGHQMARRVRAVRWMQAGLAVSAVALGVVASAGETGVAPWIGVIGTVSGAVIAHSAAGRYDFLQLEYFRTAAQLRRIMAHYLHARSSSAEREDWFVQECERTISFQNEAWMIELVALPRDNSTESMIPPPV